MGGTVLLSSKKNAKEKKLKQQNRSFFEGLVVVKKIKVKKEMKICPKPPILDTKTDIQ